jgi:hypothetical protein
MNARSGPRTDTSINAEPIRATMLLRKAAESLVTASPVPRPRRICPSRNRKIDTMQTRGAAQTDCAAMESGGLTSVVKALRKTSSARISPMMVM